MLAGSIIKDFNIFEAGSLHFSMGSVTYAMASLVLETVKLALSRHIVPTVPFATHRAGHAQFLELVLKGMSGVLTAGIRMMPSLSRSAATTDKLVASARFNRGRRSHCFGGAQVVGACRLIARRYGVFISGVVAVRTTRGITRRFKYIF